MAFDLVQYFNDQLIFQKPLLLNNYDRELRDKYILEINTLTLGKLVTLWRDNDEIQFEKLNTLNDTYLSEIANSLITSKHNQSTLKPNELKAGVLEILTFQLEEILQLETTGSYGKKGLKELILGQIEHLSGHADDWVWSTNGLLELQGSKTIHQEDISLDSTMKEFNQMVQQHTYTDDNQVSTETVTPTWAKIIEPVVALVILWIVAQALCSVFA